MAFLNGVARLKRLWPQEGSFGLRVEAVGMELADFVEFEQVKGKLVAVFDRIRDVEVAEEADYFGGFGRGAEGLIKWAVVVVEHLDFGIRKQRREALGISAFADENLRDDENHQRHENDYGEFYIFG